MQNMLCIKYRGNMPTSTCIAKQKVAQGKQGFGADMSDPGCKNCWQGKLMELFVKFMARNEYLAHDEELLRDVEEEDIAYG